MKTFTTLPDGHVTPNEHADDATPSHDSGTHVAHDEL